MSTEILPGKLSANRAVSAESQIVVEEKKKGKKKRGGGLLLFLMAVGLGAVALVSITLLAPVAFYGHVDSPGSIDDSGSTKSGEMTITGYSDKSFSTELSCSIDSLPAYCSGSPVIISGLPPGGHVFTIAEPLSDETTVGSFSWDISG